MQKICSYYPVCFFYPKPRISCFSVSFSQTHNCLEQLFLTHFLKLFFFKTRIFYFKNHCCISSVFVTCCYEIFQTHKMINFSHFLIEINLQYCVGFRCTAVILLYINKYLFFFRLFLLQVITKHCIWFPVLCGRSSFPSLYVFVCIRS